MAGLAWSLTRESDGLFLGAYGFNDKLHVLLSKLVHGMRHLVVKPERFDVVKDSLLRQLQNWKLNAPHEHAMHYTRYLLMTRSWTTEEKEAALQGLNSSLYFRADYLDIKPKDVQTFIPELLSNLHYESQIHGNASKEDAFKLTRIVQDNLGARLLDIDSFEGTLSLILPEGIVLYCDLRLRTNRYQDYP